MRLFSEEGRLEVASVSHRNPEKEVMLKKISQAFSQLENPHPRLDEVIHLRKAIYGGAVGKESLQELGLGEETLNQLLQLNLSSYVVVPLVARDKVLGIMNFISDESKIIFDSSDASFHQDIGRLAALCLENSKLYDEANREVTIRENVLGIVSHDLKNPISVIKLSAQLLKELESSPQSSLPGNIMTVSERIQNATDQMLHLIDGVLDLARIQSGKMVIEVKPHKLSDIVDPILSLLSTNAQQKGITLKRNFPPELPLIYCDKISMNQVLLNLVGNAIKFTPEGGKVTISALDLHDSIEIQVTDNGTGIPKEQLARIFDRFWQGDKDADLGVGLGLSIVKSLVTAHHGRVWVDSVLGHGSCFHVNLPLNLQSDLPTNIQPKAEFSTTQISRSSNTTLGGTRILLIDDSPELLMLMKLMLQNVGAEVVATESPSKALNYLRQGQHFDILLTDIEMPEFNGFDLIQSLKQLRNDLPLAKMPVAAITAHHRKECLDHIIDSGFDDYVLKPINQKEMILTIKKLLRHYRSKSIGDPQVHLPVSESISPM